MDFASAAGLAAAGAAGAGLGVAGAAAGLASVVAGAAAGFACGLASTGAGTTGFDSTAGVVAAGFASTAGGAAVGSVFGSWPKANAPQAATSRVQQATRNTSACKRKVRHALDIGSNSDEIRGARSRQDRGWEATNHRHFHRTNKKGPKPQKPAKRQTGPQQGLNPGQSAKHREIGPWGRHSSPPQLAG